MFQIRKHKNPKRDRMLFRLANVDATDIAELGDPASTTMYSICIYDESGDTPGLVAEFVVPPGGMCFNRSGSHGRPCWRKDGRNFKYRDPQATNDGLLALYVKAREAGHSKVVVVGRGENIPEFPMPLNVDSKVIVQLVNDAAPPPNQSCWSAEFREPVNKNRKDWFRDRTD